jgi:hypothetical protein
MPHKGPHDRCNWGDNLNLPPPNLRDKKPISTSTPNPGSFKHYDSTYQNSSSNYVPQYGGRGKKVFGFILTIIVVIIVLDPVCITVDQILQAYSLVRTS